MGLNYHQRVIDDLCHWIVQHRNETITTQIVAERAGFSLWYTQRLFKMYTGITLGRYTQIIRLGYGVLELLEAKRTILDVALQCGYTSQQSFIRAIKIHTGLTPGKIKRLSKGEKVELRGVIESDLTHSYLHGLGCKA